MSDGWIFMIALYGWGLLLGLWFKLTGGIGG